MDTLTQEHLKELLDYNSDTGVFVWNKPSSNRVRIGSIAGSINSYGYRTIRIDGKQYMAHRLAWMYMNGDFPYCQIDHIDHNRENNRIANLRDVSRSSNLENQIKPKSNNSTGYLGVSFYKERKKFAAQIQIKGKKKLIGYFENAQDAHDAYVAKKRAHHLTCTI